MMAEKEPTLPAFNCIMVFSPQKDKLLLCQRRKNPYKGLNNLVGGKIEPGEDGLAAAYRELWEETGLEQKDITLRHMMDFTYYIGGPCRVEIYVGRLQAEKPVQGEENELFWSDLDKNFFDSTVYAGEGNIGHMMELVHLYAKEILPD